MSIEQNTATICRALAELPDPERIEQLNAIRRALHDVSPFRDEPVDLVEWVPCDATQGNEYNPNKVAPPEMRLLEHSIASDGYTQPIVTHHDGDAFVVVDGFHRHRVGRESKVVRERVHGYLPVVRIRAERTATEDRMASTVRHNRARGVHGVEPMTELVCYLAKKGWDDAKIGKELGMDSDEVLRFRQISGLAELFADQPFSEAWEVDLDGDADEEDE